MPIFSYLAIPTPGASRTLYAELDATEHCEVIIAENKDICVLVTDTPDEETEKNLQKHLSTLPSLQSLSMTFGHVDEEHVENQRGDHEAR